MKQDLLVDMSKFSFFNTFINKQILLEPIDLSEFLLTVHVVTSGSHKHSYPQGFGSGPLSG